MTESKSVFTIPTGKVYNDGINSYEQFMSDSSIVGSPYTGFVLQIRTPQSSEVGKPEPIFKTLFYHPEVHIKTLSEDDSEFYETYIKDSDNNIVGYSIYKSNQIVKS